MPHLLSLTFTQLKLNCIRQLDHNRPLLGRLPTIAATMVINPHKLGVHKLLKHIPLNALFDAPSKARLRKAVNIADLRLCAKQRAHKVRRILAFLCCIHLFHTSILMSPTHKLSFHTFNYCA